MPYPKSECGSSLEHYSKMKCRRGHHSHLAAAASLRQTFEPLVHDVTRRPDGIENPEWQEEETRSMVLNLTILCGRHYKAALR